MDADRSAMRHLEAMRETRRSVFAGIYLTLFSIIGSVAVGLVAQDLAHEIPRFTLPTHLNAKQWLDVLLAAATFSFVGAVLVAYVLTVSYFYWEPSAKDVLAPLTLGLFLCLAAAHVTQPSTWLWWVGLAGLAAVLSFLRTASRLKWRNGEIAVLGIRAIGRVQGRKEEIRKFAARQRQRVLRSAFGAGTGAFLILAYAVVRNWYQLPGEFWVAGALVILVSGSLVLFVFPAAFAERSAVLGDEAGIGGTSEAP